MSLWVKIFTWLSPKPMTAAECRSVEAPLADWKDLQARVFRNVPELAYKAAIAKETAPKAPTPPTYAELENANLVGISATKRTLLAVSKPKSAKSGKKPQKSKNVSRETYAKHRKRSK